MVLSLLIFIEKGVCHEEPILVPSRVSNGTEFSCPAGQRDRHAAVVPGQRDSGTRKLNLSRDKGTTGQAQNLATGRDGPGLLSKSGIGHGTGQ